MLARGRGGLGDVARSVVFVADLRDDYIVRRRVRAAIVADQPRLRRATGGIGR